MSHIVALRGDPPKGSTSFAPAEGGFGGSIELTRALADEGFEVTVAGIDSSWWSIDMGRQRGITPRLTRARIVRRKASVPAAG